MLRNKAASMVESGTDLVLDPDARRKAAVARALLRGRRQAARAEARTRADELPRYRCVEEMVAGLRPDEPVFCLRPGKLRGLARRFIGSFPGRVLYAVKCNPHPEILRALYHAGVRDFDVASVEEIALIETLFGGEAGIYFNHPAKSRAAIRAADRSCDVRHYVVDHESELAKVLEEARDDNVVVAVRLATSSSNARYDLSTKFGATPEAAQALLRRAHRAGLRVGLAFHVGSQCLAPESYTAALALCGQVSRGAEVPVSVLNVGGGFPAPYPGDEGASLKRYFAAIVEGQRSLALPPDCELLCEPGRALVAAAASVVAQVVLRKDQRLHINDGVFGGLQELRHPKERRPAKLLRPGGAFSSDLCAFKIYGPTCDSDDVLGAPMLLPVDTDEGDWIEIGMMGAYSIASTTRFNGFSCSTSVSLDA